MEDDDEELKDMHADEDAEDGHDQPQLTEERKSVV